MDKYSRFFITCLSLLILLLLFPGGALAQNVPTLAEVEVDIWPEFDRPTVLVIYRITLSSETALPAELTLRIPEVSGIPNAVAVKQPDGSLINLPFDQKDAGGGWSALTFSATAPELQIEYYDPGLVKDGVARHFVYRWSGDYAVQNLSIEVQQPMGATNMKISPSMGTGLAAADGLVYFSQPVGALVQGQTFEITVDYEKANDELSAGSMPVSPAGSLDESTSGRLTMVSALPWVLGFVGVALIVGGGVWYWRAGRKAEKPSPVRSRPRGPAKKEEAEESNVYCHQCGKRAAAGDRFCRACGTQLRLG